MKKYDVLKGCTQQLGPIGYLLSIYLYLCVKQQWQENDSTGWSIKKGNPLLAAILKYLLGVIDFNLCEHRPICKI